MSMIEDRIEDAKQEVFQDALAECPECHHASLFTRESYVATRVDPAASSGSCMCHADSVTCKCRYEW